MQEQEGGCVVPISHSLNKDGYFRKRVDGRLVMYHRHVWEVANGEIPKGYEVDHKCKNRSCCNVLHLQMMKATEHRSKDNAMRYLPKQELARAYWEDTKCSGAELVSKFETTTSTACRWIRKWKGN